MSVGKHDTATRKLGAPQGVSPLESAGRKPARRNFRITSSVGYPEGPRALTATSCSCSPPRSGARAPFLLSAAVRPFVATHGGLRCRTFEDTHRGTSHTPGGRAHCYCRGKQCAAMLYMDLPATEIEHYCSAAR